MVKMLKQDVERLTSSLPEEHVFRCCDGRILRNMRELRDALYNIADETYKYHAGTEKTDFSNWGRAIIKDEELARDLSKSANRKIAAKKVD